jgi:hypothetical protein
MSKTSIGKNGVITSTLLNNPIVRKCQYGMSLGTITVSKDKTYYVEYICKALGDGECTSSNCSSICYEMFKSDWSWSRAIGTRSSAVAYSQIGKLVKIKGSFKIPSANDGEQANQMFYWLINGAYGYGTDNQTHELYYYKIYDSDGVIIATYGTDRCALDINDWVEV